MCKSVFFLCLHVFYDVHVFAFGHLFEIIEKGPIAYSFQTNTLLHV